MNNDLTNDFLDGDEEASQDAVGRIAIIAKKIQEQTATVKAVEIDLKKEKKVLRQLEEIDAPALMDELGFAKIELESGQTISVIDEMFMSIAKKNKQAVADWLLEVDMGSLISRDITVSFTPEEAQQYEDLKSQLENYNMTSGISMNTGSIKSAVKELIEEGEDVPFDILGINRVRRTKIK